MILGKCRCGGYHTCDGECIEWLVEQVKVLAARVMVLDDRVDYCITRMAVAQRAIDNLVRAVNWHLDLVYPEGGDPGLLLREGDDV